VVERKTDEEAQRGAELESRRREIWGKKRKWCQEESAAKGEGTWLEAWAGRNGGASRKEWGTVAGGASRRGLMEGRSIKKKTKKGESIRSGGAEKKGEKSCDTISRQRGGGEGNNKGGRENVPFALEERKPPKRPKPKKHWEEGLGKRGLWNGRCKGENNAVVGRRTTTGAKMFRKSPRQIKKKSRAPSRGSQKTTGGGQANLEFPGRGNKKRRNCELPNGSNRISGGGSFGEKGQTGSAVKRNPQGDGMFGINRKPKTKKVRVDCQGGASLKKGAHAKKLKEKKRNGKLTVCLRPEKKERGKNVKRVRSIGPEKR